MTTWALVPRYVLFHSVHRRGVKNLHSQRSGCLGWLFSNVISVGILGLRRIHQVQEGSSMLPPAGRFCGGLPIWLYFPLFPAPRQSPVTNPLAYDYVYRMCGLFPLWGRPGGVCVQDL